MSSPRKQWRTAEADGAVAGRLASGLGVPLKLGHVLAGRGFGDVAAAGRFLDPRLRDLSDPFDLPGMTAAADRILQALARGERIAVFGDYDVDGITGTLLLRSVLRCLGGCAESFLPDRHRDGYGLTAGPLQRCLETHDPGLLITVDCGTSAVEPVALANEKGIDVIVTDHHELHGEAARALALVNPKQDGCEPTRELAGVGVAFKLCHAVVKRGLEQELALPPIDLREWLDLVALGVVADVVPLTGENRILARRGLERLNRAPRPGVEALLRVSGVRRPVRGGHVAFMLAPRLNAAGRMGDANEALELLVTEDPAAADDLARRLDRANEERRRIEQRILARAQEQVEALYDAEARYGLVAAGDGWDVGVIGIVASRLCETHRCPSVVIGFGDDGVGRGSARSAAGVDVLEALRACHDLLEGYGGHTAAAGLTVRRDALDAFRERLNEHCAAELESKDRRPTVMIDAWLDLGEADYPLLEALSRLAPFGVGNPEPKLGFRDVRILGPPRIVGSNHLKMTLTQGARRIEAIAFGMANERVPEGGLDVVGVLQDNAYGGRSTLQVKVTDFRAAKR